MLGARLPLQLQRVLLAAAQRNDRQAQNELIRRYEPLVQATVRRLRLPERVDREDTMQEARLGAWDAIVAWSQGRATFAGFAARCVFYREGRESQPRGAGADRGDDRPD